MQVALVTGASQGFGRAFSEGLIGLGWSVVVDARDRGGAGQGGGRAAGGAPAGAGLVAIPGDVTDGAHPGALLGACDSLGGLDLLVNNASTLGPTPLPRLAGFPLDELRRVLEVNTLAPCAHAGVARPVAEIGNPRISTSPRTHRRALRRLGRLRPLQGRAGPLERHVRRRGSRPSVLGRRSGRHEDRHAPGGLSRRGHLGSPVPGRHRAGVPRPRRRRRAERSLPCGRAERRDGSRHDPASDGRRSRPSAGPHSFELPAALEASVPPEARGLTRDAVRLLVARSRRRLAGARDLFGAAAVSSRKAISRDQHLRDAGGGGAGTDHYGRCVEVHLSTQLPAGLWTVELRGGIGRFLGRWPARAWSCRRRTVHLLAPYATHAGGVRLWVAKIETPTAAHLPGRSRAPHRLRLRPRPLADQRLPERLRHRAGFGRDAERGTAVHGRNRDATRDARASASPHSCCTPASRPGSDRGRPIPSTSASPRAQPTGSTTPTGTAAGSSPSAPRSCARSRRWSTSQGFVHAGSGWTDLVVTPDRIVRSIDGLLTGWHEPEASHLAMFEAIAGRELLERSYAAALKAATCGTSSAMSIWFCRERRPSSRGRGSSCRRWRLRAGRSSCS